ncbi:hypothetical protein [Actinopolyspora mzabensis]|uniref:hypothetical protein n=1 Tax=Actinopolyspora mzabensis TaxID=995066 RepID=UPI00115F7875|nr:hypothetical protein [Actinopolyspora mzabensis]
MAVFVVLALLGGALHGRLARAAGTRKIPTLAATTALAAGTAVTLTPQSGPEFGLSARRIFACPLGWPDSSGLLDLPMPTQSSLNSLVLLPFGVCAGLAVRDRLQTAAVVAVILLLPALVEASQGFTLFVRHCKHAGLVRQRQRRTVGAGTGAARASDHRSVPRRATPRRFEYRTRTVSPCGRLDFSRNRGPMGRCGPGWRRFLAKSPRRFDAGRAPSTLAGRTPTTLATGAAAGSPVRLSRGRPDVV